MMLRQHTASSAAAAIVVIIGLFVAMPASTLVDGKTIEDFRVVGLENVVPAYADFQGDMFAGLLPIDELDEASSPNDTDVHGELMFWLFQPHDGETAASDTLTVWFNGGPGCTSFQGGVLFECSPVTTPHASAGSFGSTAQEPLVTNHYAWTKATNMLFVEQPVNTGFSWGDKYPQDEEDLSIDFYNFLLHFYRIFPHYQTKELYLFGESYAGMYVPSMAHEIVKQNRLKQAAESQVEGTSGQSMRYFQVPLAGIGLGNGWMDATVQGPVVIDYAWWHGMIDSSTKDKLYEVWEVCKTTIRKQDVNVDVKIDERIAEGSPFDLPSPFHPFTVPFECNIMEAVMDAAGAKLYVDQRPNAYDVSTWDYYPILWDDNGTFSGFYNNPEVKKALHAPLDTVWQGCIPGAGRRRHRRRRNRRKLTVGANAPKATAATDRRSKRTLARTVEEGIPAPTPPIDGSTLLAHDKPECVVPYLAELLDTTDVRVLVYSGDRDLTTCSQGSEMLLDAMEWSGKDGWKWAPRGVWQIDADKYPSSVDDKGVYEDRERLTPSSSSPYTTSPTVAGYSKEYAGLMFVTVYNSGHLVPHNKPVEALDLITRMVTKQSYIDQELPSFEHAMDEVYRSVANQKQSKKVNTDHPRGRSWYGVFWTLCFVLAVATLGFYAGIWYASQAWRRQQQGYSTIEA